MIDILKNGRIFGIVGSKHSGKTSLMISMIEEMKKTYKSSIVTYFYHEEYKMKGVSKITSINELEHVENSIIFVDEFYELFQLSNRHNVEVVKCFLAQIEHNNNVLVLCGLPDYFKKYISSQINTWFLMKLNYDELINGSALAKYIKQISGSFKGGTMLNIKTGKTLVNGNLRDYTYYRKYDKKAKRENLFVLKSKQGVRK